MDLTAAWEKVFKRKEKEKSWSLTDILVHKIDRHIPDFYNVSANDK